MAEFRTIKAFKDQKGVFYVSLNRPSLKNAFNEEMIEELTSVFQVQGAAQDVRAIVLRGEGSCFCAGGDLNWMKKSVDLSFDENLHDTRKLSKMFAILNECPKPVIGRVHGAAIGGGVGLVSICDSVLATEDTQFSLSEVRLGIIPACIGPFVLAKIGASFARSLFITAQRFQAARAKEIGLVHEVLPDLNALDLAVERTIDHLLQAGPQALMVAKRFILELSWPEKRNLQNDYLESISRTLAELRVSPEGQEGLRAFLEKRKPKWLAP
jgi:methylglutaconyl-CoA hydratase